MSIFKFIIFFWVAMAAVKWLIVVITITDTMFKNKKQININSFLFFKTVLIVAIVKLISWPIILYIEGPKQFFTYPDKKTTDDFHRY